MILLSYIETVNCRYIESGYNEVPAYIKWNYPPRVLIAFIFIPCNENTDISKEYMGADCI